MLYASVPSAIRLVHECLAKVQVKWYVGDRDSISSKTFSSIRDTSARRYVDHENGGLISSMCANVSAVSSPIS